MEKLTKNTTMHDRFRGYLPVVVDLETSGFDAKTNAILQISANLVEFDKDGYLIPGENLFFHTKAFAGAVIEDAALKFTGINLNDETRKSQEISDCQALDIIFKKIRNQMKQEDCNRAILVAHNANFDKSFLQAAVERCNIKRDPFHPFSTIDTVSLAALAFGQTVLAKACFSAGIQFEHELAHCAKYDAIKTTELFCQIVNTWRDQVLI